MLVKSCGGAILKKNRKSFFLLIFCFFFILLVFNDTGLIKWYQLHTERKQILADIQKMIKTEKLLNKEISLLENDDEYIKKMATEKFHMVKPGEKIFKIIDKRNVKNE